MKLISLHRGPLSLGLTGLEGDERADLVNHGGADKAVCVDPAEHCESWRSALTRPDPSRGAFGENFIRKLATNSLRPRRRRATTLPLSAHRSARVRLDVHHSMTPPLHTLILCALGVLCGATLSAAPPRPNVLFLIVDDMTTTMSCQKRPGAKTPHLDQLAARGVRFEKAFCQFAVCNPARASFLTGCYPEKTGVMDLVTSFRDALPEVATLPRHFKNHGYRTASVGKVFHVGDPKTTCDLVHRSPLALDQGILDEAKKSDPSDVPRKSGKGFDYNRNYAFADRPDHDFTDHQIAERAIASLAQLKDTPFFMAVGFIRPHTPFVAPQWAFDAIDRSQIQLPPFYSEAGEDTSKLPESALRPNNNVFRYAPPTREQALDAIHAYLAAVHFVDHQIGRLLAELDRLGLTGNTFIALTGDHGYQLGEHGLWAKQTLFEEANHVPLIFAGPGIQPGVSKALVEQVDIYPTLASLAGLPLPAHLQGTSLVPWLDDPTTKSRVAVFSTMIATHTKALGHSVRNGRYRYIEWNGGEDGVQLYDLQTDPHQLVNLAAAEAHRPMRLRLKRLLVEHLAQEEIRLHFKPGDHALGDVHPFFHQGECFLYYLKPGNYEAMLVRSRDSLRWTPQPLTHAPGRTDDWMSPYFVLGVFRDEDAGLFRSFHGHAKGLMASQTSVDLLHWDCAPKEFHVPAADYYERRRDPFVFWIPDQRRYGCVMTTWIKGRPKPEGGGISLATSPDLKLWTDHGIVLDLRERDEPECPQMFQLGARWYLLASIYHRKSVGGPVYYTADRPEGPWTFGGKLDGKDLCAAQVARDDKGRLLLYGWIPLTPATAERQHWGGHLALAREVHVLPDGSLATRLAPDIADTLEKLAWTTHRGDSRTLIESCRRFGASWTLPSPGETPSRLDFAPLGFVEFSKDGIRICDAGETCWSALEARAQGDFEIRVFVEDDRVEVFADGRHSLCARLPAADQPIKVSWSAVGARNLRTTLLQTSPAHR